MSRSQHGFVVLVALTLAAAASSARAGETLVADDKALAKAIKSHQPGDAIVLKDGEWRDAEIKFYAKGTEQQPVTLRAQTPGKVVLTGTSTLRIGGEHGVVDGLAFRNAAPNFEESHVIQFRGLNDQGARHCRLTNTSVVDYNPADKAAKTFWVSLYGRNNRVDHCHFAGKSNTGPTLVVWVEAEPNEHVIERNHFAGRPPLGENGGETMRIGTSEVSMNNSRTRVQHNLFTNCDGEAEIISNKSCENVYRGNTFVESAGCLTLRHGDRCVVEGNAFLGNDKPGTGGVRLIGEDHKVYNNYLERLAGKEFESAMPFVNGIPNSKPNEYFRVKRAVVAFNTLVDCAQSISFGVGSGARNRLEPPMNCTIANNLVTSRSGPLVRLIDQPIETTWAGNLIFGAETGLPGDTAGVRVADPKLTRDEAARLSRPGDASPALGSADGDFPFVTHDIDGQPRPSTGRDVGCDQRSDAPIESRVLTSDDVGPGWMRGR